MAKGEFHFTEESFENIYVFYLSGKIMGGKETQNMCTRIKELIAKDIRYIVMNFRNVKWINSVGIGAIIGCLTTLRNSGGDICITNVHDAANKYFRITKLDSIINIFSSVDEAIKNIRPKI
jgi:anti-sigma B factor antagonist